MCCIILQLLRQFVRDDSFGSLVHCMALIHSRLDGGTVVRIGSPACCQHPLQSALSAAARLSHRLPPYGHVVDTHSDFQCFSGTGMYRLQAGSYSILIAARSASTVDPMLPNRLLLRLCLIWPAGGIPAH
jgi:hypothetical protein